MLDRHDDAVRGFADACRVGDVAALRAVLDHDAFAVCDGGGLVPAALAPVHGAEDVAWLVAGLLSGRPGTELTVESVNGRDGPVLRQAGRALAVVSLKAAGVRIAGLWIVLNPTKLGGWHRL